MRRGLGRRLLSLALAVELLCTPLAMARAEDPARVREEIPLGEEISAVQTPVDDRPVSDANPVDSAPAGDVDPGNDADVSSDALGWTRGQENGAGTDTSVVENIFSFLRPAIVGLIAAAAVLLMSAENFGSPTQSTFQFIVSILFFIFAFVGTRKYKIHPILVIVICGIAGLLIY